MKVKLLTVLHTLMAGIPSLGTSRVCQKPTPAVNAIASALVKLSTNSVISAVAILDGAIENFKGVGSPICAKKSQ